MLKKARKYINDRVDWEAGNGMLMLMLVLLLLIIYTFAVVVEIGGWYYTAAVVQTKTDAIIEGAAVMADTGYVAADEIDPAKPGIYKSMTEIDNEAASEQAYELYMANLANLPNIVEDFKYVHNIEAALGDTAKLDYNQRVYTGIGTASATNFFNLLERSQYKMSANGKVKVVGVELPLEDTTRFAEMYPDDPRIPISALTNNTGDTMAKLTILLTTDNAASIGMNHKIHGLWYIDTPFSSFVQNLDKDADVELLMGLIEEEPSERYISCPNFSKSEISLKRMFPRREQSDYNDVKDGFFLCCVAGRAITSRTHLIIIDMAFTEKYKEKHN